MKHQFWIILIATFALSSCKSKMEQVENVDSYGYTERYSRDKETFAKEGLYQQYDDKNRLIEEAQYKGDTLHGMRVLYYEQGDTQIVEHYQYGAFDGPYRVYYESGKLQQEGRYANNEMVGEWERYYENGQLMEKVQFENNMENGPFVEYYENGNLKAEGAYLDGDNEHGELKLYDEQGELMRKMNCKKGICRTVWERGEPTEK
jgi:antitoxin component YwqK of YwqJK toxin-antitoxin module